MIIRLWIKLFESIWAILDINRNWVMLRFQTKSGLLSICDAGLALLSLEEVSGVELNPRLGSAQFHRTPRFARRDQRYLL